MRLLVLLLPALALSACGAPAPAHVPVPAERIVAVFASADRAAIDGLLGEMQAGGFAEYEGLLVANLAHADRGVREWSAHALGDLGFSSEGTIGALIQAFGDDDDWVRWKAVRALGMIGPRARRALPVIEPAAKAEQEAEVVRAAARVAVERIRGE